MTYEFGDPRLPERFWEKVTILDTGCWEWTAAKHRKGYGQFRQDETTKQAHRVSFVAMVHAIPEGLVADHTCHNPHECQMDNDCPHRACVHPGHLALVTGAENSAAERRSNQNRTKTECVHGHAFDAANTYHDERTGRRACITCRADAARRYEVKRTARRRERAMA